MPSPAGLSRNYGHRPGSNLIADASRRLLAQMFVEKRGNLAKCDGGLRQAIVEEVLRMRLAFINLKLGFNPSRAQRSMHPHGVAQQQVACTGGQDGRREPGVARRSVKVWNFCSQGELFVGAAGSGARFPRIMSAPMGNPLTAPDRGALQLAGIFFE